MARKKGYIEQEVTDKAMLLFWRNGYETTSMQMLEKEMGINKFSIYSSFGNKDGLFIECIKSYKSKLTEITNKLEQSNNGLAGIQQYFFDFLDFSKENNIPKGCLITNAANELNESSNLKIANQLSNFTDYIKSLFVNNLKQENYTKKIVKENSDYLIVSMFGLASASKVFNETQLNIYIKNIFKNI